jgi:hypothetical protein
MLDDNSISEIKKKISILEWDLVNVKDEELKSIKLKKIEEYKKQLKEIKVV